MENVRLKRVFGITFIAFLTISALVGIFTMLLGSFGDTELKVLTTSLAISGYSITGFTGAILYDRQRCFFVALSCMGISIIGLLLTIVFIWQMPNSDNFWRATATFAILALALAHTSILFFAEVSHALIGAVRSATLLCIAVATAMLVYLVLFDIGKQDIDDYYYRIFGTFLVLAILGTVVIPIIRKVIPSSK